jgi:hypothetical protein
VFNLLVEPESLGNKELELYNKFLDAVHANAARVPRVNQILREILQKRNIQGLLG